MRTLEGWSPSSQSDRIGIKQSAVLWISFPLLLKILAGALKECHRKSSTQGKALALKVFVAGRNRLENDGATALAEAFRVSAKSKALRQNDDM